MSMEDYIIDDINSLTLNCGISPSLKNVEMNQLSDEIMFICNNIIFDDFDHDTYKDETDKLTFMTSKLFPNKEDRMDNNMVKKMPDFKVTLESLIEKLDFINSKKTRLEGPKMVINAIIFIYIFVVVALFITYMSFKFGDAKFADQADNYDIGFVSTPAYIYLFSKLKDHYFEYSELQGQMGHYDENICGSLANIIKTIKSIYKNLLQLNNIDSCKETICADAVELYELVYVKDVFRQARAHFKTTVSSINAFVDKQKKYLLKVHNINMDVKNNNEYMEEFYNIILKGYGIKLLKGAKTPIEIRNDLIQDLNKSVTITKTVSSINATVNSTANTISKVVNNAAKTILNTETNEGFQAEEDTKENKSTEVSRSAWDTYIIEKFIDKVIVMNKIKLNSAQSVDDNRNFMKNLTEILYFLKKIKIEDLPEYDQIKKLIFPVNMEDFTEYSTDSFIELINPSLKVDSVSIETTDSVLRYFETTVFDYYIDNNLINTNDNDDNKTYDSFLAKITKRNSNVSMIKARYSEFINVMKSRILVDDDLTDDGLFGSVFEKMTNNFIENTEDYKLNENIVMRYMTFMFKNDEQFNNTSSAPMVLSNIRFVVGKIMKKVTQVQTIRNDLMDSEKINTAKYISFLSFESKLSELNDTELKSFFEYIKKTKETIKSFRRYTKTEEIMFSKKEQINNIYSKVHRDIFIVMGIILYVFLYEQYFKDKFAKIKLKEIEARGKAVYKGVKESAVGRTAASAAASAASATTRAAARAADTGVKTASAVGRTTASAANKAASAVGRTAARAATAARKLFKKGGEDNTNDSVTTDKPVKKPVNEESQYEKDTKETEKALSFNKYINMSLIVVVYGIMLTFTKSYLMKHTADLQYDKVTNVVNTTKFETEFFKLTEEFEEYKKTRSTDNCKKVYHCLINVLDIYDKCNFIKSSIKSTPFPLAEMWTNGIVLLIFLAILYITFVQTDVDSYWKNQDKLDELLNNLNNMGSAENQAEMIKNIEKNLNKEKLDLKKAIENNDWNNAKNYMYDIYGINEDVKSEIDKVFDANSEKTGKKISKADKEKAYQDLVDKLEKDMKVAQEEKEKKKNEQQGGMTTSFPMTMIDPTKFIPTNNKAQVEKKLFEKYTNQVNTVKAQLNMMKRDTKYVNLSMSILILMFGSYFCVTILNNTRAYQNMLVSSGDVYRDCL